LAPRHLAQEIPDRSGHFSIPRSFTSRSSPSAPPTDRLVTLFPLVHVVAVPAAPVETRRARQRDVTARATRFYPAEHHPANVRADKPSVNTGDLARHQREFGRAQGGMKLNRRFQQIRLTPRPPSIRCCGRAPEGSADLRHPSLDGFAVPCRHAPHGDVHVVGAPLVHLQDAPHEMSAWMQPADHAGGCTPQIEEVTAWVGLSSGGA
jgi:hypothetical protein